MTVRYNIPRYLSERTMLFIERWCVENRGLPFGSRITGVKDMRSDFDIPVSFRFNGSIVIDFPRDEFDRIFVRNCPSIYLAHRRPRFLAPPEDISRYTHPRTHSENLAFASIFEGRPADAPTAEILAGIEWMNWLGDGAAPAAPGTLVDIRMRSDGFDLNGTLASEVRWTHNGWASDVVQWRPHRGPLKSKEGTDA